MSSHVKIKKYIIIIQDEKCCVCVCIYMYVQICSSTMFKWICSTKMTYTIQIFILNISFLNFAFHLCSVLGLKEMSIILLDNVQ